MMTNLLPLVRGRSNSSSRIRSTYTSSSTGRCMISTRVTELFGCDYPIILPGMSWISTPPLVSAVSEAGGIGILATGPLSPEQTRKNIREIRDRLSSITKKKNNASFGVGITLLMPGAMDNLKVALEEKVPILNVSLGKTESWVRESLDTYDGKLLVTVTNKKHAYAAISSSGADAIMVTGHEAAAHGGDVTSLVLIPTLSEAFPNTPIIGAGGFATGRGLNAALALGADGIAMGSRLAVTKESPLSQTMKELIVDADSTDTIYGDNFDGIPARVLKTPISTKLMKTRPSLPIVVSRAIQAAKEIKNVSLWKQILPGLITRYKDVYTIAQFGSATSAIKSATVHGNEKTGVQFVGQCQGLIHDIPYVDDLIQRIVLESSQQRNKNDVAYYHHDQQQLEHLSG